MFYSKQYNQYVTEGTAFILGDVQYPSNFLNLSSAEEKASIGLVEVQVVGSPSNEAYYWVSTTLEDGVMTYVNTPKDLVTVQESAVSNVNNTAYTLLFPSDWMIVKAGETGEPVAQDWKDYRAAVRTTANLARDGITACTTVDELAAFVAGIQWPHDPNYVLLVEPTPVNGVV